MALGGALAFGLAALLPTLSALTVAVLFGLACGPLLPDAVRPSLHQATGRLLRVGIVLLGLQLSVPQLFALGPGTTVAVVVVVATTFVGTLALGRLLRVPPGLGLLVATGFSICGAAAIAAMGSVARAPKEDVATSIALVTLYGSAAILAVPLVGPALGLTGTTLGLWAGQSVHEVGQVVAAASPAGPAAVAAAVVVKLSRVVLLAPMVAAVSVVLRRRRPIVGEPTSRRPPLVPLFVLGFLAMIALRSTQLVPMTVQDISQVVTTLLLAGAMFGLGASVRVRAVLRSGSTALLLGLLSTLLVATVAFAALSVLG
ncbi:MAG: YeiH family protein [Pseudonocardiaceae bacterium]